MEFQILINNLTNPTLLFFLLGIIAVLLKSDLEIPQSSSKFISLYLLFSIGFKGGQELANSGVDISDFHAPFRRGSFGIMRCADFDGMWTAYRACKKIMETEAFGKAVMAGVGKSMLNSGQTCSALTRMLVPKSRLAEAETAAALVANNMKVGDPFAEGTNLGPLASAAQRDRVQGYIQKGIDEGAVLVAGGLGAPDGLATGYYVRPTVFSNVKPGMTIEQEEIFGPVLSIIPYEDDDDAVRIANGTVYGLAGAVFAADKERALAIARRMRTGQVEVNGGAFNANAPFGGYKQSGIGRELGEYGFEEFLEIKSLQM